MTIIKVNYNNAYIKLPDSIFPFAIAYHENGDIVIEIYDSMTNTDFYTNYHFDIYINGDRYIGTIDINSDKRIVLVDDPAYNSQNYFLTIKGYYYNELGNKQDVNVTYKLYNSFLCSETTICSELTICNDL